MYATVVEDQTLAQEARLIARRLAPGLDETTFTTILQFAAKSSVKDVSACQQTLLELSALPGLSKQDAAAVLLARAAATSPAEITPIILTEVSPFLTPESVVELIVWLSLQQLLHRIGSFYAVTEGYGLQNTDTPFPPATEA